MGICAKMVTAFFKLMYFAIHLCIHYILKNGLSENLLNHFVLWNSKGEIHSKWGPKLSSFKKDEKAPKFIFIHTNDVCYNPSSG